MKRGYAKRWRADGLMQAYGKLRLSNGLESSALGL